MISHRLDVLAGCDLLLVLEQGNLQTVTANVRAEIERLRNGNGPCFARPKNPEDTADTEKPEKEVGAGWTQPS